MTTSSDSSHTPPLGATVTPEGTWFRVWATNPKRVEAVVEGGDAFLLRSDGAGMHTGFAPGVGAGARYRYRLDGGDSFPDPASRFQPEGVHGPSEVIDSSFEWTDTTWSGLDRDNTTIYELHIGTFTEPGTFRAAIERLPAIAELGVSAIQVMPLADFAGDRNWGYDGVCLFAPSRAYGRPEDVRAFVDAAHGHGLGVILDVVYNHFGPDGAYHGTYSSQYFNAEHNTPWGSAINLDAEGSEQVREFLLESARHWLHEYHVDGFRLDAVHMLFDTSELPFLAEFRDFTAEHRRPGQPAPLLIAEEHWNRANIVRPRSEGGDGFDVSYADDWHHEVRTLLTRSQEGYFMDYAGSTRDLAISTRQGWLYTGEFSHYDGRSRGTDPSGLAPPRFLHALQNHDQVGNRAFGDRIYHEVSMSSFRAGTMLLLCTAATPQIFQGDEWACSSPFMFFTDHEPELGKIVREGRRNEFRDWSIFRRTALRDRIPDPQSLSTFERSRLNWDERSAGPHQALLRLHQALFQLRREHPALRWTDGATQEVADVDDATLAVRRDAPGATPLLVISRLMGAGPLGGGASTLLTTPEGKRWVLLLTTEDPEFVGVSLPIELDLRGPAVWAHFRRPGAVILELQEA